MQTEATVVSWSHPGGSRYTTQPNPHHTSPSTLPYPRACGETLRRYVMVPESTHPGLTGPERLVIALGIEVVRHRLQRCIDGALALERAAADLATRLRAVHAAVDAQRDYDAVVCDAAVVVTAFGAEPRSLDWDIPRWIGVAPEAYDLVVARLLAASDRTDDA